MNLALVPISGEQMSRAYPRRRRQGLTPPADFRPAGAQEHFRSIWHLDHHDLQDSMNSEFRKGKTTPRVGDEPSDHPGVPPRSPRHCPIQRKDEFAAAKRGEGPPKKVKGGRNRV
jgi:hypothetical protein